MKTFLFIGLLILTLQVKSQAYTLDPSFSIPFQLKFLINSRGTVNNILESNLNGKIFLTGEFEKSLNGNFYPGYIRLYRNGMFDLSCKGNTTSGSSKVRIISRGANDLILVPSFANYLPFDTLGNVSFNSWRTNYLLTARCGRGVNPYFYPNGASLMIKAYSSTGGCAIFNPPDTFPHRYIVKVDSLGLWDSSFVADANDQPTGFIPYDSNRIIIWGLVRKFTHYDGQRVNGLCRIFLDGTLDTTFHSPLKDTVAFGLFKPFMLPEKKELFLLGDFHLAGDTAKLRNIVRLKENGDLDSSFSYSYASHSTGWNSSMSSVVTTLDGGYLVSGIFDSYQGYSKNAIVKLDSNGIVEPQFFTSLGPDSSSQQGMGLPFVSISKSKFGGYYVYGDFAKWDGVSIPNPIVRIHDQTTGLLSQNKPSSKFQLYPNPSYDHIVVRGLNGLGINSIAIRNLLGQEQEITWENKSGALVKVNTANLPSGVYVIALETKEGVFSKKFIKQ